MSMLNVSIFTDSVQFLEGTPRILVVVFLCHKKKTNVMTRDMLRVPHQVVNEHGKCLYSWVGHPLMNRFLRGPFGCLAKL